MQNIKIIGDEDLMPKFIHTSDAGCDLMAAHFGIIMPGDRALVQTGIQLSLPDGYAAFVHPRSGLALNSGVTVLNAPGTIDAGYTGEIGVILYNSGKEYFSFKRGDRIAQLVFQKIEQPVLLRVQSLDATERNANGFGSTGV